MQFIKLMRNAVVGEVVKNCYLNYEMNLINRWKDKLANDVVSNSCENLINLIENHVNRVFIMKN